MVYFGHMGFFNVLWIIVCWVAFILFIVWLLNKSRESEERTPLEIIKKRYAKGELTKRQFEDMKKEISR